jgi:hypothetical protein
MSAYEPAQFISDENQNEQKPKPQFCSLYMVTHLIISFFAIYLSWRCNNGFKLVPFIAALLCPYLYIIWALATKGGCGVFDSSSSTLSATSPMTPMSF